MIRMIEISEHDLELIQDACYARSRKYKADAERTKSGYGRATSSVKREEYIDKAEELESLVTRIAYEFI